MQLASRAAAGNPAHDMAHGVHHGGVKPDHVVTVAELVVEIQANSDRFRRYCAIRDGILQLDPTEPAGHLRQSMDVLALLINGILGRRRGHVRAAARVTSREKQVVRCSTDNGLHHQPQRRQLCWAHLIRDFQKLVDRGGESAVIGQALLTQAHALFRLWHRVRDGTLTRSDFAAEVHQLLAQGAQLSHAQTQKPWSSSSATSAA